MWPQKRRLKSEFPFFQSLLQLLQPFTLSNVKFSWPFSACLGHCNWPCLQSTTMNLQEWKRRKWVAGHGILYCWACSELSASMLFEEDYLPSLFLLIFYWNLNEYCFLSRICNVVCRELCAVLSANLHYFSLSLSQTECKHRERPAGLVTATLLYLAANRWTSPLSSFSIQWNFRIF